jgi:hypothetical protein
MDEKWSNNLQSSAGSVPQQPNDDWTIITYVVQGIVLCLATLLMTLRLLSKRFIPRALDAQDGKSFSDRTISGPKLMKAVGCAAAYVCFPIS